MIYDIENAQVMLIILRGRPAAGAALQKKVPMVKTYI